MVLGLVLAAGTALGAPAAEVLFEDPFTDLSRWNAPEQWRVEDGALVVSGGNIRTLKSGHEWTNYALEFDVVIRKMMAQWVIRAASEKDCLFIQLTANECPYSPNSFRYHKWRDGKMAGVSEDALPGEIEAGKSYHIRCEVVGHTVQTLIDGKVRGSWSIDGWEKGTIGFRADGDSEEAVYRNLRVLRCDTLTPLPSPQRPQPKPARYDPFLNPPFRGEWIWGPEEALNVAFRHAFEVKAPVLDARLWITCDNAFTLYVNGKRVGAGSEWQLPKVFHLKPYLRQGRNVLAVAGRNESPGAAGVLAEGNILLADGTNVPLISSARWRAAVDPPSGWTAPGFNDRSWAKAASLGRHPQAPWAGQVEWKLPYLGPQEIAEAESLVVRGPLQPGRPITLEARFRATGPRKHAYPVRLLVTLPGGGKEVTALEAYPKPATTSWKRGWNTLRLTAKPSDEFWLPAGRHKARLEVPGIFLTKGAERLRATVTCAAPPRLRPLPLSKRPMGPGLFTDQFGRPHRYRVERDAIVYDGRRLVPIEYGDGAYWCLDNPARGKAIAACRSQRVLDRIRREGLTEEPVAVRLLDVIECASPQSEAAHEFSEDDGYGGRSRLMRIGDRTYRVTDSRRRLSYFAYTVRCRRPGRPHLLVFETPNDRERYTMVRVQPPWRNIGCGPYTGRDLPCDGKAYQAGFLFYPEEERIRFTVSRLPCELPITPESGGAVSRVWLFEVANDLASRRAEVPPSPGPQRRIGLSLTHSGYLYELYGRPYSDVTQRLASLNAFADYAEFTGLNHLEFNAVNGADTSETAYYPSRIFQQYQGYADLFREFLPIAEERGFTVVPCLTSLAFDTARFTKAPWITPLTYQIDRDGFSRRDFFANRGNDHTLPDPLRPEVQKIFLDTLREFGERCKSSPAVTGLAFRLNGKIGLCYVGYSETETAATAGYSPWNLSEFQRDTGIRLPGWDEGLVERWVDAWKAGRRDDPAIRFIPTAYEWIRANCWEEWIDWRCRRTADLWRRTRDLVRSYRKDWNLVVKCDMPSETPDRNILWPAGESALELFRTHGFDPRLYAKEPGILLQQGYFLGGGEFFQCYGDSPYAKNPEAWEAFDRQPGLAELYRTPAGASVELYHNYWEEFGVARMGEFATDFWGAGMMYPRGRAWFRPLLHALRAANAHTLALFSWERGSQGHEGDLRRFCRAYRSLPAVAPRPFARKVVVTAGPAADDTLWVRRFGGRIALVNESAQARTVRLTLPSVKAGQGVYEYASQRRLARAAHTGPVAVTVSLDAYDLRVLGTE
ncbi:MAG: hypothetical protein GX774_07220 [Armatimonadetes bacterium]|nr:hypothetical protein [Armatimonadota bacterium]